jgi:para-nitrobenzyl esterase
MRNGRKIIALAAMTVAPITAAAAEQSASASGKDIVVAVDSGKLRGMNSNGLLIFKGIPYAEPPVGQRRWRPPVPVGPWIDIRPAVEFGADCEQTRRAWDTGRPDARMSEDCLTLNIWAPDGAPPGGWPVMFWIHGGSYTAGSSAQPVYDGARLAGRGVVLVTINYRLGRFGFFAHPALTREAAGAPVGNFGIMDQISALRWVKRNIAAFGGNPNNITIFGESAGGGSVNRLMISKAARGLFQRAIAQSGGGRERSKPLAEAEAIGKAFADDAGIQADDAAALRALPIDVIRGGAQLELETNRFSGPMIDGQIIQEDVDTAFAAGRQASVPYIAGSNSDEIAIIAAPLRPVVTAGFVAQLGDRAETIRQAYGSLEAFQAHVMSDAIFSEPARYLTCAAAENGAYLYRFDYVAEGERSQFGGAPHAYEIPFVFGTLDTLKVTATEEDRAMSEVMIEYWTGFAKAGSPSALNLTEWSKLAKGQQKMLLFASDGLKTASTQSSALDALAAYATQATYGHFGATPQPLECKG